MGDVKQDPLAQALARAEQAEARAQEAEAAAAAAHARAEAVRLRHAADSVRTETSDPSVGNTSGEPDAGKPDAGESEPGGPEPDAAESGAHECELDDLEAASRDDDRPVPARRPNLVPGLVSTAALLIVGALVGLCGYFVWQHHLASQEHQRAAEFAAAARQGVVNMTSLDFKHADEGVGRILDNATGEFKDDFQHRAKDFTTIVQDSEVVTAGKVNATAVQSMTRDSAVVLVTATSEVTNSVGAQKEPRSWRLSVTVSRDAGQLKLSKVEFVP